MESKEEKVKKVIHDIILKTLDINITSDVDFSDEQIELLHGLNEYSLNQIINDPEILRDPRKIPYKTSVELKTALIAINLAKALANPLRRNKETKEFFEENIAIATLDNNEKNISFGNLNKDNVKEAIEEDIIQDWKIFRDKDGHGIITLINEKTALNGLPDYKTGGDVLYEFARFHRKYTEQQNKKEQEARESAQEAFRNAMMQTLAVEVTKQQLIEGKNPLDMVNLLFAPEKNKKAIAKLNQNTQNVDFSIEQSISLMLENKAEKTKDK